MKEKPSSISNGILFSQGIKYWEKDFSNIFSSKECHTRHGLPISPPNSTLCFLIASSSEHWEPREIERRQQCKCLTAQHPGNTGKTTDEGIPTRSHSLVSSDQGLHLLPGVPARFCFAVHLETQSFAICYINMSISVEGALWKQRMGLISIEMEMPV